MSTNDVPGHNPNNSDELAMGCWAEHDDGSLIFVESTEGSRVIFCVFDMSKKPPVQYRDAMPEDAFKRKFSWKAGSAEKWTWHDKTPFPWDHVIKAGTDEGFGYAVAEHQLTAAERVAESLKMRGRALTDDDIEDIRETKLAKAIRKAERVIGKLQKAISELRQ